MLLRLTTIVVAFLLWVPVAQAWTWPVKGPVLQAFSFDESHPYAAGQHRGIDIGASATGDPVVAPASGTISFAGSVPTSGKSVTIQTSDGYSVTLTHLGSIAVVSGASVAEGATVGTVGPSGTPEEAGPYVHLGIRHTADANGYLDPLSLLPPLVQPPPGSSGSGSDGSTGSGSASSATGSGSVSAPPKRPPARSGGGIVIRSRPATAAAPSRSGSAPASAGTATRTVRARTGNADTSGRRPEMKHPSRHRPRARTPQRPPIVETRPGIVVHALRPVLAGATHSRVTLRRPVPPPVERVQPLQLGLAAGPGILAGLAAIATALVRLRRRRRSPETAAVVRLLLPSSEEASLHHAA